MDRTEKLISILRDQDEMKIQSDNDGISCDGGFSSIRHCSFFCRFKMAERRISFEYRSSIPG